MILKNNNRNLQKNLIDRMLKKVFTSYTRSFMAPTRSFYFSSDNKGDSKNTQDEIHRIYSNPMAAGLKKDLNDTESTIKIWQESFKAKHGRKPTMEEMKRDPEIGHLVSGLREQKQGLKSSLNQAFRDMRIK